ncbi:MAG: hypothetical protein V1776_02120 [Candidatus Diapherotrites archaeon]
MRPKEREEAERIYTSVLQQQLYHLMTGGSIMIDKEVLKSLERIINGKPAGKSEKTIFQRIRAIDIPIAELKEKLEREKALITALAKQHKKRKEPNPFNRQWIGRPRRRPK